MANNGVSGGSHVTIWSSVTEGPGVTPYASVTSGATGTVVVTDLLLLMTTGQTLLMSGSNLLQVQ